MSLELQGKSILFIGPETFNYEKEIVAGLERLGAQVIYRSDKPGGSLFLKALLRLYPKVLWRYSDHVFGEWLSREGPAQCDFVFIVKGEGLSPNFIKILKNRYRNASFILYLWDSIRNVRDVDQKFLEFDRLWSFDSEDCRMHPLFKYRPLFFLERYQVADVKKGKGLFFIGTLNGDRPSVIARIVSALPIKIDFNYWLFVRNGLELSLRSIFDKSLRSLDRTRLLRTPMPLATINQYFESSAAILDIEHPKQVGLTMRTFEVLASGKKLITTNRSIASHDFYDPTRICIVDRCHPKIDAEFLDVEMGALREGFFAKYSLRGWLLEVFECAPSTGKAART